METVPSYLALWLFCMTLLLGLDEASGWCLESQKALLVEFNQSLILIEDNSQRISVWDSSRDCCDWPGVTCNNNGYVTGLDLSYRAIYGNVNYSSPLFELQYLSSLNMGYTMLDFRGATSSGFERLVNLKHLDMIFIGRFPMEISNLTRLVSLNLYSRTSLPNDSPNLCMLVGNLSNLLELDLYGFNFTLQGSEWSKVLPSSLPQLQRLVLNWCSLSGPIHTSFQNLTSLSYIDLSGNDLSGPFLDIFSSFKNLTDLNLAYSNLEGPIPKSFTKLTSLTYIDLSYNHLNGPIPLFSMLKNLSYLFLQGNRLTGSLATTNWSELPQFRELVISYNNLNGTFQLDMLQSLKNLWYLDLSYNNLSVDVTEVFVDFPNLSYLSLASCKLKAFPKLVVSSEHRVLEYLDLSANQITGLIPKWVGNVRRLNLSYNKLHAFETPLQDYQAELIILNSNKLQGNIPNMSSSYYVDLSSNIFRSSTFSVTNKVNISARYFSVANNYLLGRIPESMCHIPANVLDLSNNFLSGEIPRCLMQIKDLLILNLGNNSISGLIPDSFPLSCNLFHLNLNGNNLHGDIPKSLGRCRYLEVLDLGNNKLQDIFPCWMRRSAIGLRVLVLKSNLFYGNILCSNVKANWRSLQVIDISLNKFNGSLPSRQLEEWMPMITKEESKSPSGDFQIYISYPTMYASYIIPIGLTVKGSQRILERIPISFTMIDFSANAFQGPIPKELGYLYGLRSLDVSYNRFTGQIPGSLGNLQNLETLDLRNNALTGRIPVSLSSLDNLEVLNLSYNHLEGMIPTGRHFQTFDQYSFVHNKGLCGLPLTMCKEETQTKQLPLAKSSSKFGVEVWISAEVGFALGLGFIIMPLVFWPEWRRRFYEFTDNLICR